MSERTREASGRGWRPDQLGDDGPGGRGAHAMIRVLWAYRRTFGLAVLAGSLQQGLQIVAGVVAAYITTLALLGADTRVLLWWVALLLGVVLVRAVGVWVEAWVSHDLAFRMLAEIRMWLFRAFDRIGFAGLARRRTGDLVARVMSDSEGLEVFYAHTAIYVVVAAVLTPVVAVVMLLISPLIGIVTVAFLLLAATVPFRLRSANLRHGAALRARITNVNVDVVDVITGLREILSFGQADHRRRRLDEVTEELAAAERGQGSRGGFETATTSAIVGLGALTILLVASLQTLSGEVPLRLYAPTVTLGIAGFGPLMFLLNVTRVTGITNASADRVFDLLAEPPSVPDTGLMETTAAENGPVGVSIRGVSFRYDPQLDLVLDDVSFDVAPGETVALVGHSGAGKSTLGHLLLRFFDPEAGEIAVGGTPLEELSQTALTRVVAHVPQDVFLFHDTLHVNVTLGAPDASADAVARACRAAAVSTFVERLPRGLQTVVGERGARLSGGERQRVAVARALLHDCPVLVLDEAASQLDPVSEHEMASALDRLRADRTTLVIAHRLSTIRRADRVVVLDHGRVVAIGSHDQLMANPTYARLVQGQLATATPPVLHHNALPAGPV